VKNRVRRIVAIGGGVVDVVDHMDRMDYMDVPA